MKVVVTGASGLLGRSLIRLLTLAAPSDDYEVIGLAYSRAEEPLRKLDLLDAGHHRAAARAPAGRRGALRG